jgi:hypothetical protein
VFLWQQLFFTRFYIPSGLLTSCRLANIDRYLFKLKMILYFYRLCVLIICEMARTQKRKTFKRNKNVNNYFYAFYYAVYLYSKMTWLWTFLTGTTIYVIVRLMLRNLSTIITYICTASCVFLSLSLDIFKTDGNLLWRRSIHSWSDQKDTQLIIKSSWNV